MPAPHCSGRPAITPRVTARPSTSPAPRSNGRSGNAMPKYSCRPTADTAAMKPANSTGGSPYTMTHSAGIATAAVRSRVRSTGGRPRASACEHRARAGDRGRAARSLELIRDATEATLTLLEVGEGLQVFARAEIRPERLGNVELRVRCLPQEEVAEPHLAARPDEEVGIRDAPRPEVAGHRRGRDLLGLELAAAHAARDRPRGARDLLARAVAHRE